ncbi:MAG TPA: DNA replication/repair protein RecF [Armatimonadetes bacterium]|nr:DNA replication/repair protein RecF [Armatimonadota bacterium]
MFLQRLELTDYRNYAALSLALSARLTVLRGHNAQGKTNLLEAVALLALTRSPRGARDGELIRWGANSAVVRGEAARTHRPPVAISLTLRRRGAKSLRVDGQPCARLADGVGELVAVYFGPGHLQLVSGSPEGRRDYLNTCWGQVSPAYLRAMSAYRGILRQRNSLLRRVVLGGRLDSALLDTLDDQLAEHGGALMAARAQAIEQLAAHANRIHALLSGGSEQLQLTYDPHVSTNEATDAGACRQALAERLVVRRPDELRRGVTLLGPHRDDLGLTLNGADAKQYGSQGQQRSAALALKLAELAVLAEALDEAPLLLLDDVLSELDTRRREATLELAEQTDQVILTSAEGGPAQLAELAGADVRWVENGQIRGE